MNSYWTTGISLLIDGLSFGMILFLISSGLTITLGVMRLLNIAHCGFAMIGGYTALSLVNHFGLGLLAALPIAVAITAILGAILERTVYRWIYETSALGQILMTIGLTFIMIASINAGYGSLTHTLPTPEFLAGAWHFEEISISAYRSFLSIVSLTIAGLIWYVIEQTDFGARLRASVDNPRMARCVGINVRRGFAQTFVAGCALAAIAGVLGTQMLPLQPYYATNYMVMVLIVVAVGGFGSLKGSLIAALGYSIFDTYFRYLFPAAGAFGIYILLALILSIRPFGLYGRA
ncbi:branched-chain amino acid ABC transporter permease [Bradyrhizobium guangxiense]|uniref:branched-chain amino acid ABC transporter permease n=1 Tax=Bradyrhizobium guangxiense TaxID=1325115 RepID=UPI001008A474|nr:branched-chain amino acid ABC transporter permease [Bradyrhizobium guangxiense]